MGALVGTETLEVVSTNPVTGNPNPVPRLTTTQEIANLVSGGGGGGVSFQTAVYTSNVATVTLPATPGLLEIIRQGAPAAITVNLPSTPPANLTVAVKDGGNGFSSNNATVKTTDGTQIDGVPGTSGFVMRQDRQSVSFVFDGTMWNVV